jgi:uncharacterized short protein YbdD (DUF466 family)
LRPASVRTAARRIYRITRGEDATRMTVPVITGPLTWLGAALKRTTQLPAKAWQVLRSVSGDDAYERYLEHLREHHSGSAPLDRLAFYLCEQERRFNDGPTSCC